MKKSLLIVSLMAVALAACSKKEEATTTTTPAAAEAPAAAPTQLLQPPAPPPPTLLLPPQLLTLLLLPLPLRLLLRKPLRLLRPLLTLLLTLPRSNQFVLILKPACGPVFFRLSFAGWSPDSTRLRHMHAEPSIMPCNAWSQDSTLRSLPITSRHKGEKKPANRPVFFADDDYFSSSFSSVRIF
jgi:hypothetical protein